MPDVSLYVFLSVSFTLYVSFYINPYVVFLCFSLITLNKTLQGRVLNAGRKPFFVYLSVSFTRYVSCYINLYVVFLCFSLITLNCRVGFSTPDISVSV